MAKELKNYSLYLLAIVGIVAVVGIVLMVSGKGSCFGAGSSSETEETLLAEEGEDLAGMAIQKATYCYDYDAKASDPFMVMSSVKYGLTSNKLTTVLDSCKTISGKTYLLEGTCYNGKFVQIQKNCAELKIGSGANYKCVNGACVECGMDYSTWCIGETFFMKKTDSCSGKSVTTQQNCSMYPCGTSDKGVCVNNCIKGTHVYICSLSTSSSEGWIDHYAEYVCGKDPNNPNINSYSQVWDYDVWDNDNYIDNLYIEYCPTNAICYDAEGKLTKGKCILPEKISNEIP